MEILELQKTVTDIKTSMDRFKNLRKIPKQDESKELTPTHIRVKYLKTKNKENNLGSSKIEMTTCLQEKSNSNESKCLIRNHEVRRKWHIFQVLKEKNCQLPLLYPEIITFRNEREIKT